MINIFKYSMNYEDKQKCWYSIRNDDSFCYREHVNWTILNHIMLVDTIWCTKSKESQRPITNISIKTIHSRIWITDVEMVNVQSIRLEPYLCALKLLHAVNIFIYIFLCMQILIYKYSNRSYITFNHNISVQYSALNVCVETPIIDPSINAIFLVLYLKVKHHLFKSCNNMQHIN